MSIILRLVKLPVFASFAGIATVAALLWYLGPLLPIPGFSLSSQRNRVIVIIAILIVWGLYQLIKWLLARRKNKQLAQELAKADVDPIKAQTEEELALLQKIFEQSLQELKKARFDQRQGSYLYQLPWYLIIGPPGSGKTTALVNSGLNFPLAKRLGRHEVQGIGGTRNCDWFFTDQAVLIDTAGRYTTQDSEQQVDSAAWQGFLDLLRQYRPQRPINGVIVAISLADLLQSSESERNNHVFAIRQRIQELHQKLNIRFPVYVLFTKVDLIAGYMEFFDDLSREERLQVWGMSFPLDDLNDDSEPVVERFSGEFELLEKRLNERLLERLQSERDSQRRDLIYTFPQQFNTLKGVAQQFLNALFLPNRFEQRTLLRGVYFTSGTQEGNPIDRMLGALAAAFGITRQALPRFSGGGKSYFLNRLFKDVIFAESGLAGSNPRLQRRRTWLQRIAYASVLGLTAIGGLAWFSSYASNRSYVDGVEQQVAALNQRIETHNQANGDAPDYNKPVTILPLLNEARAIPGAYTPPESPSLLSRLGLYQGAKLAASASTAYRRLLDRAYLPRLIADLEQQLWQQETPDQRLYNLLATYLALQPAATDDPAAAATAASQAIQQLQTGFSQYWQQDDSLNDEQRQRLRAHLDALLERWPLALPKPLDTAIIERVRERFPERLSAEQLYQELIQTEFGIETFRVSKAAGNAAASIFLRQSGQLLSSGIAGIFRQPGQLVFSDASSKRLAQLAQADPVLGRAALSESEIGILQAELQALYWQDYCQRWQHLVADIASAPATGLTDAKTKLALLTGPNSPWRSLLTAIAAETKDVAGCLTALNQLVTGEAPTPLDTALEQLNEVALQLEPLSDARQRGESPDPAAVDELLKRLEQLPLGVAPPLNRWISELLDPLSIELVGGMRKVISDVWRGQALAYCRTEFKNRYPLVATSEQDLPLASFSKFFGPGGVVDRFLYEGNHYFSTAVDMRKPPWRWNNAISKPGIPPEKLQQLYFASQIKRAFFTGSGQRPEFPFELRLIALAGTSAVELRLGQQRLQFSRPPSPFFALQWPGANDAGDAKLRFNDTVELIGPGPWGWFRLLDRAQIQAQSDTLFRLNWQIDDYQASFELKARTVANPLSLNVADFQCPQTL